MRTKNSNLRHLAFLYYFYLSITFQYIDPADAWEEEPSRFINFMPIFIFSRPRGPLLKSGSLCVRPSNLPRYSIARSIGPLITFIDAQKRQTDDRPLDYWAENASFPKSEHFKFCERCARKLDFS
jgi:hypothetical protein